MYKTVLQKKHVAKMLIYIKSRSKRESNVANY